MENAYRRTKLLAPVLFVSSRSDWLEIALECLGKEPYSQLYLCREYS